MAQSYQTECLSAQTRLKKQLDSVEAKNNFLVQIGGVELNELEIIKDKLDQFLRLIEDYPTQINLQIEVSRYFFCFSNGG